MVDHLPVYGPDGGALPDVRPGGVWPWLLVALGAAIVAIGGILLGGNSHDQPQASPATSAATASGT
jgi:hypothetical protein